MTKARHLRSSLSTASAKAVAGTDRATASEAGSSSGEAPGTHQRTMPAPARWAALVENRAAPNMPGEPATTRHAERHLLVSGSRAGSQAPMSASSTNHNLPGATAMPIGAISTRPDKRGPSPINSPGLSAAIVTVSVALTAPAQARPVSASRPEGTSIASRGVPAGTAGARYSPLNPVP